MENQDLFLKFCDVAAESIGQSAPDHDVIKSLLGWAPKLPIAPHINVAEIVAILKLVCAGMAIACPIVDQM